MAKGKWDAASWRGYSSTHIAPKASAAEIYTAKGIKPALDPRGIKVRESRDSDKYPESNAVMVFLDVTGSMDPVIESMARKGLEVVAQGIYDRKPITDPQLLFGAVGDAEANDRAPLQVTQFEVDIKIAEQLLDIYNEGRGGGNNYESYTLPWYFAAMHTSIDCFEKRKKKGYLFTVGDEEPNPYVRGCDIERVLGYKPQFERISSEDLLTMVSRQWNVFHIIVEQGSHFRRSGDKVTAAWKALLGQRVLPLSNHTKLGETILSAIQVAEGVSREEVVKSWEGSTSVVVARALGDNTSLVASGEPTGVVRL